MEAKSQYFNEKGFGLIFGDTKKIYDKVRTSYIIVKDVKDTHAYVNANVGDSSMDPAERLFNKSGSNLQRIEVVRSDTILRYLTTIHKKFMNQYRQKNKMIVGDTPVTQSHTIFDVIFIEIGPYIKHTIEYACLMYMCLLHMGIELPEFYVISSFPTGEFDYLEHFIFNDPAQGKTASIIDAEMKGLRSLMNVPDNIPETRNLTETTITSIVDCKAVIIITQDQYGWKDHISIYVKRSSIKFENLLDYKIWFSESSSSNLLPIITIDNPMEILSEDLDVGMIIFDTRIKVEVDLHYLGNVRRSREALPDWYNYYLKLLAVKFPDARLVVDQTSDHAPIVRGTKERTPINDVLYFKNDEISLYDLYLHYYNNTTEYTYAIKSSLDTLNRLGYFSKNSPRIVENLHPIFPRMMQIWVDEKKFPRFAFLIVIAIISGYSHKHTEISKSDERSSRFKDMLDHYLHLMEHHNNPYPSDLYNISNTLRRLADKYMKNDDKIGPYDSEDIMRSLIDIIKENFDYYVITLQGDSYRSKHNQNLVWQLMVDNSEGITMPKQVFPLVVYSTSKKKKIALYIPLHE